MKQSYVYILKWSDSSYYTGVTSKLNQRLFQHESGFYPDCYTFTRRPIALVFYCEFTDINLAIEKEEQIKK
ncbi:GIY-YIG nuclease family protein [Flavobacterium limnosediminis]|uniref:GIY-YIG nuclease family protein n=1 Tax=Flavobacterium limnosediminis TaxID=1401027 RepID=UPI00269C4B4E|nr:GIY-YIG nuclease family protein [Flavobacterium limnosediminis]